MLVIQPTLVQAQAPQAQPVPLNSLHIVIPGGAGGGWDLTARAVGQSLQLSGLANTVTFENLSGGGGAKGIAHTIAMNRHDWLLVNSTPIVVRTLRNTLPQGWRDLTPVASMIGDYSVFAVRQQSPLQSMADLVDALAQRRLAIGGGSVLGGTDHIVAELLRLRGTAEYPNIKPIKYIPYDAGGKAMAGLLSGEVDVLSSGFGEVVDLMQQGWVRILCVAAPTLGAADNSLPLCNDTIKDLIFVNWRGFFMAPDIPEAEVARVAHTLQALAATPEWQSQLQRYQWVDLNLQPPEFKQLLESQEAMLSGLLRELGFLEDAQP